MHAAVRRGGRRGIGPVHRSGAETVSYCVFPFCAHLLGREAEGKGLGFLRGA